jgi:hypothetical protein
LIGAAVAACEPRAAAERATAAAMRVTYEDSFILMLLDVR